MLSFLVTGLTLCFAYLFFTPFFTLNDDHFKLMFAKGIGTNLTPSPCIGYSNVILGYLLNFLYKTASSIPWYPLTLVTAFFLGMWALLYAILLGPNSRAKLWFFILGCSGIHCYYYFNLQFTMAASIASQGGLFLLASLWRNEERRHLPWRLGWAGLLLLFGSMLRFSATLSIVFASVPFIVFLSWKQPLTSTRKVLLGFMAVLGIVIGAAYAFDQHYYDSDPVWKKSYQLITQGTEFWAYRTPVYNAETKPVFDSIGWSRNDLDLIWSWWFAEPNTFSAEKIAKLNAYFPKFQVEKKRDLLFLLPAAQIVLFFMVVFLFFLPSKPLQLVLTNILWIFMIFLYFYFCMIIAERVFLPIFSYLLYLALFFVVPKKISFPGKEGHVTWFSKVGILLMVVFTFFTGIFLITAHAQNQRTTYYSNMMRDALAGFHPQDNQLFVIWDSAFPFELIRAFDSFSFCDQLHLVELAVFQQSPHTFAMLDHFGVKDLAKDLVDNPNLFLICVPYEMNLFKIHMRERYGMEVDFVPSFTSPFFSAYQVKSVASSSADNHSPIQN